MCRVINTIRHLSTRRSISNCNHTPRYNIHGRPTLYTTYIGAHIKHNIQGRPTLTHCSHNSRSNTYKGAPADTHHTYHIWEPHTNTQNTGAPTRRRHPEEHHELHHNPECKPQGALHPVSIKHGRPPQTQYTDSRGANTTVERGAQTSL